MQMLKVVGHDDLSPIHPLWQYDDRPSPARAFQALALIMESLFFDSWRVLFRTAVVGLLAYVVLVTILRVSGRRTLSKMNAFDFVVTVALGSTLATILLNKDVALAEGALALALLVGLQYAITWSSVRVGWIRRLVTGEPLLLFYQGDYLPSALRQARVTRDEVQAAVRSAGVADLGRVDAVVLETDGSFSVVRGESSSELSSLTGVQISRRDEQDDI